MKILKLQLCILLISCGWADISKKNVDTSLRKPRKLAISAELGGNSLASIIGAFYTIYPNPQLGIDFGVGYGLVGIRPGIRVRYNFSPNKFSPFIGTGLKYGFGTKFETRHESTKIPPTGGKIETTEYTKLLLKSHPSPFLDITFGFDYMAHNGFLMTMTSGYSILLRGKNYEIYQEMSLEEVESVKATLMSGLILAMSLGKAF